MGIRTLLVGLHPLENRAFEDLFARMRLPVDVAEQRGVSSLPDEAVDHDLVIIGYEADGCGLPMAVRLLGARAGGSGPDCVMITDHACPALSKTAEDLGLLAVLNRPVSVKALASVVVQHVTKQQMRRAAHAHAVANG